MKYNEKGSVTMIVAVTILFIVILLSSFLVYTSARRRAQIEETALISNAYDGDMDAIYEAKMKEAEEEDKEVVIEGVTIPKGFYYVGGTKATGIVISDAKADENVYSKEKHADQANIPGDGLAGNQFVWVPVENFSEFKRYPRYYRGSTVLLTNYHEPSQERYRYPNELEEYESMMQSVEDNYGFYVARYEAGKENINGIDTVVSKKNAEVWTNIQWGTSMTEIGTTGAVAKAQGMYTDKTKYDVTSTLIYGTQWDAIMAWIDTLYKTSSCEASSFVRDSTLRGNYMNGPGSNKLANCGSNNSYRIIIFMIWQEMCLNGQWNLI